MAVTKVKGKPNTYLVVVYDRVRVPGARPEKVQRQVVGKRAANQVERDLLADRDRGSLVARRQSLVVYAEGYLKSRRTEVSRQTLAGYRSILAQYITRHDIGSQRVSDITVSDVAAFYSDLLERGSVGRPVRPETVRGVHRVLSMILKRAVHDGLLHVNPCTVAKPPKDEQTREASAEPGIDPQVAREWLAAVAGTPVYAISAVALGTGLRRSELLALRWQDVDLDGGTLDVNGKLEAVDGKVERTTTKTKRSARVVPFGASVAAVLRQQKATIAAAQLKLAKDGMWTNEPWVFPSLRVSFTREGAMLRAGRLWTPNAFAQEWRQERDRVNELRLAKYVAAGGEVQDFEAWEFGIHALRHAYATVQLAAGVRDEVVSRRLGHASSLITRRVYSHVTADESRDGVDVADGLLNA